MADGIKIKITSDDESVLKDLEKIENQARKTFERAAAAARKTSLEIAALDKKMRDLAAAKRAEIGTGMPWKPEELDAAVDKALETDKVFQRMSATMDRLQAKWEAQSSAASEAKEAYSEASRKADEAAKKITNKASILDRAKALFSALADRLGLTGREAKKTEKSFKKVDDRAKPLTKTILKLSSMLKLLLLRMVMRKVIEAMRQGFQDLAQYSTSFNKTMSQLSTTFLHARNSIATAFAPVLEALTPIIIDITNRFIDTTNIVAAFTANLFGNATTFTKAKKAAVDYAKSVAGAAKANKKALASFDELNILNDNSDTGMPEPSEMFEEAEIDATILTISDKVKDMFEEWKKAAQPTIEAVKNLVENLKPLKEFVADGLINFYERFLKPVGTWVLGEGIPRLVDALKNGLAKIEFDKISAAFNRLWDALRPFAVKVGEGLVWLWENVLVPLGVWTANELLPAFLDLLSAALDALGAVIEALEPVFLWFWNEFLQPIAQWTGEVIIKAINWLTDALKRFSDWARENPEVIRYMGEVIIGMLAGIWVYNTTKKIITFLGDLGRAFAGFASGLSVASMSAFMAAAGFGALVVAIVEIINNWDKMNSMEKTVSVLGAVAIAAAACAAAVGALQSAWSLGVAAVAIVAGIAAIGVAIGNAKKRAEQELSHLQAPNIQIPTYDIPKFATGAVIPPNNEFLAVLGDQKSGRNFEAPESLLRQIVREESDRGAVVPEVKITFTGSLAQLGRVLNPVIEVEQKRVGRNFAKGGAY